MTENRPETSWMCAPAELQTCLQRVRNGIVPVKRAANERRTTGFTSKHLGKLNPISQRELNDLIGCWLPLLEEINVSHGCASQSPNPPAEILIVGLAESGIIPSFAMQQACSLLRFPIDWCCSSRCRKSGFSFLESHSHAPVHYLSSHFADRYYREIWVIEDEITTGKTLINFAKVANRWIRFEKLRIFALLDSSSLRKQHSAGYISEARERIDVALGNAKFDVTFNALFSMDAPTALRLPNDDDECCVEIEPHCPKIVLGESIVGVLPRMMSDDSLLIQHGTLSPWAVDGTAIHSRIKIDACHYLYNWQTFPDLPTQLLLQSPECCQTHADT